MILNEIMINLEIIAMVDRWPTVQYSTVQYSTVQYSTVQYTTAV